MLFCHTRLYLPVKVEGVEGLNRSEVILVDITNDLRNAFLDLLRVFLLNFYGHCRLF